MTKTTSQVLMQTEETLQNTEFGLEILTNSPTEKRLHGLRNLVVFGRSVTNCLQGLRHIESDFDDWYDEYKEEMKTDPLLRYFYKLRSMILKEGNLQTSKNMFIGYFNSSEIANFPKPKGATSFFLGDNTGGSGWNVLLSDGTTEKFYVKMNDSIVTSFVFPDAPEHHLGGKLETNDVVELATLYVDYLKKMVNSAKIKFNLTT